MIRSTFRSLGIACAVLGPAELTSQSWLEYRGTVDARFHLSCSAPEGSAPIPPQEGPFAFFFVNGEVTSQGGFGRGRVAANGTASGGSPSFRWEGQFRWGSDGSVQGAGSISPQQGALFCTGTWSVGNAAGPTTDKTVCAEYGARILRFWRETALPFETENKAVYSDLIQARDQLQLTSRNIMGIKSRTLTGSLEEQEESRSKTYARIKELDAVVKKIEANASEMRRLESEAATVGCTSGTATPRTGADKAIDELLELDAPKDPSPGGPDRNLGVADVKGQVELRSQDGSRTPLTTGNRIVVNPDEEFTIRTGPGASVTFQDERSVRRTLQPNTTVRFTATGSFKPDIVERGSLTIQIRKQRPYQIQAPTASVDAGGTVFTVSYDATTGVTGVTVEEGRVTVSPKNPAVRAVTLAPGEYVEVTRDATSAVLPAPGAPETGAVNPQTGPSLPRGNIDLTGLWRDDTAGGAIYRLRQVGNWLYWLVDGTPKGSYVNLSYGQISGNTITAVWVDMPGSPTLSGGNLILRIESNDRLVKVGAGGYGAQSWIRVNTTGGNR